MSAARWSTAAAISGLGHGALFAGLAVAVAPTPPPPPPDRAEAAFDLVSYPVPQSQPAAVTPEGAAAPEAQAQGTRAGGGAIPQSRATPAPLVPDAAAPARTQAVALRDRGPMATPLTGSALGGAPLSAASAAGPRADPIAPAGQDLRPHSAAPGPALVDIAAPATTLGARPPAAVASLAPTDALPLGLAPSAPTPAALSPGDPAIERAVARADPGERLASAKGAAQPLGATTPAPEIARAQSPDPAAARPVAPAVQTLSAEARPPAGARLAAASPAMATPNAVVPAALTLSAAPQATESVEVATRPGAMDLAAVTAGSDPLAAAAPPVAAVAPASPKSAPLDAAEVPGRALAASRAAGSPLEADAVRAGGDPLAANQDAGDPLDPGRLLGDPLVAAVSFGDALGAVTDAAPGILAALDLPADRQAAALAWSGGTGAVVDPLSLAAIQSFTLPGDPAPDAGPPVRDRIGALLASVPCARLQTEFDPDSGTLTLRGHIPEDGLRAPVIEALGAQVGGAIPVRDAVLILPRPVCGALAGIAAVGLAQSDDQEGDPKVVGAAPHTAVRRFAEGDRLSFALLGPEYPAYYYIDYFDAAGNVIHLQPNDTVPLRAIAAEGRAEVGSGADGAPALELYAAPPFGQEILAAFAASTPLYEGTRPLVEPAAPYLDFLRDRVATVRAATPDFKGEWFYIFVQTGP